MHGFQYIMYTVSVGNSDPVTGPVWSKGWVEVYLYSSMTAALEGGEWSGARPGRTLPPGETRYPFYRRLGGPQGRSGRAENLVPTGIRSRAVQHVVAIPTELPGPHERLSSVCNLVGSCAWNCSFCDVQRCRWFAACLLYVWIWKRKDPYIKYYKNKANAIEIRDVQIPGS